MPVYLPGLTFGGLGYGGSSYGFSPYGSGVFPRLPVPTTGGFGGQQYGLNSYGSVDVIPPKVTGANALDGFRVEILFSEEMANDPALVDPTNYVFTDIFGAPLVSVSVAGGTPGSFGGFTSVIVTHTGSTLGGQYTVVVSDVEDLAGNEISNSPATFSTFGDATTVEVSFPLPDDGRTVRLDFKDSRSLPQPLLTEAEFTPGVDDITSYDVSTTYPVPPILAAPTQDSTLLSRVEFDLHPMTSAEYELLVGPSLAYDYLGKVLPDSSLQLDGVEVGTGTSQGTVNSGLLMAKDTLDTYGWLFRDTSGRVLPSTTYRVDFRVDVSGATIIPAVSGSILAVLAVSDGAVQVNINLEDVAGSKVLGIVSGAFTASVPAAWDSAEVEISLIRNQQAGFFTVLLDGVPLITFPIASATGVPSFAPGSSVTLLPGHSVLLFRLVEIAFTASLTLFSSSWNFIHGLSVPFTGSGVLSRDRVLTKRGPLVRGWGDATPAVKEDVVVRVNGVSVDIAGVNPYVGEIYPVIPIPLSTPGTVTVDIDYIWFTNPAFELSGLNTRGLGLNIWHRAVGHTPGAVSPTPSSSVGAARTGRFPMGIALGPLGRQSPKAIGHRYIGYQKDYSALLNAPTTLLLNQNPHATAIGRLKADALIQSGSFNGQTTPQGASTLWVLDGVDAGEVVGDGTYRIIDDSSGSFGEGTAAVYRREVDLSLSTFVAESGRFLVESTTPDGVFTGVGFGIHDGHSLLLVGALLVDGVQHIGVLLDGDISYLESGWQIGPAAAATATSTTTIVLDILQLPPGVESGSRFRVSGGSQAGVYTISACGLSANEDGTTVEITFEPPLPANLDNIGNSDFTILFETPWDTELVSLRIQAEYPGASAQVILGGQVSGLIAEIADLPGFPAQTALLLPATEEGVAFFGSISRRATNSSIWDLVQYQSTPELLCQTAQGLTAQTEMNVLPEDDPNDPWYIVGKFGYAVVDAGGDHTLIKTTSGSEDSSIDLEFSYQRVEPFLTNKVTCDTEAKFQVESGILGAGDINIVVQDGVRQVVFTNLLYTQSASGRALVTDLPQASLSGLQDPVTDGWTKAPGNDIEDPFVRGQSLTFDKTSSTSGFWRKDLTAPTSVNYQGLIAEARFQVLSSSSGTVGIGAVFACQVPVTSTLTRFVAVTLDTTGTGVVSLVDSSSTVVVSFPFVWDDQAPHTYRILCDPIANIVVVTVDDAIVGSEPLTSFPTGSGGVQAFLGGQGTGAVSFVLHSMNVTPLRPVALAGSILGRTFGVLLRSGESSPNSINSYRIPRADATEELNSSPSAIPVLMDWRSYAHVRLYLDPTWGVSFYRPDLPLPPGFTGDFITQTTDPTAAWFYVEYPDLPVEKKDRGSVTFGSPDLRAITQSRWDFMRYRIRGAIDGFGIAPQNMVLNRAFTFTSGEHLFDVTPEVQTITSRTSDLVIVSDSAMHAVRVFAVQVNGTVLPSTDWAFNPDGQILQIDSGILPSDQYPVIVTFAVGFPITKEYLCSQPFSGSVTVLNAGTPPVPKSRDNASTSQVVFGSKINDPNDILDDAESLILNDPYRFVEFTDDENSLYACVAYCEVEDGDDVHISTLCDGPGPGQGFSEIGLEGQFTSETFSLPEGPAGPWAGQSPVIKGSATAFSQSSILYASGGSFVDGVLGPGTAVLWPNGRGPTWEPLALGTRFGFNQEYSFLLVDVAPRVDLFDLSGIMGDNVPPTSADPATDPNVDGVPGVFGNGAAAYISEDFALSTFSRLGPWGSGTTDLAMRSLLAGGTPLDGTEFILQGGAPLPLVSAITTGVLEAAN